MTERVFSAESRSMLHLALKFHKFSKDYKTVKAMENFLVHFSEQVLLIVVVLSRQSITANITK